MGDSNSVIVVKVICVLISKQGGNSTKDSFEMSYNTNSFLIADYLYHSINITAI